MASSDPKQGGFTVNDRRSFTESAPAAAAPAAAADLPSAVEPPLDHGHDAAAFPAVDFHTFVLSLGSSALLHLGELEPPDGGEPEKDLSLAKHTIDILTMLEAKTRGNLTAAEEKLMESLLYDLRLRYVNATK
ncbi:MAG TPA: DUF1844 domain-containing protein [Polyangia bacterium]|jgi:hypothetical protein